jgi:transaldolase
MLNDTIKKGNNMDINTLKTKIFADGADKQGMLQMYQQSWVKGFTTNPTLMRKAGITDYQQFALDIVKSIPDRPISFEVFSDDFDDMYDQALLISQWGPHVYVKIPVTNTLADPSYHLIKSLAQQQVKMNVTAIMTLDQVYDVTEALANAPSSYISVFAGRIADTGRDPLPIMKKSLEMMQPYSQLELIWASPRELLNIFQADEIGCHIITVTNDILKKLELVGKDLNEFSLETVKMFREDAMKADFKLGITA